MKKYLLVAIGLLQALNAEMHATKSELSGDYKIEEMSKQKPVRFSMKLDTDLFECSTGQIRFLTPNKLWVATSKTEELTLSGSSGDDFGLENINAVLFSLDGRLWLNAGEIFNDMEIIPKKLEGSMANYFLQQMM